MLFLIPYYCTDHLDDSDLQLSAKLTSSPLLNFNQSIVLVYSDTYYAQICLYFFRSLKYFSNLRVQQDVPFTYEPIYDYQVYYDVPPMNLNEVLDFLPVKTIT
jgi:hypothetical protein